jgi:hypothetical protein
MISGIRKNIMGTVSFDGKFPGMRKAQDFIVYPMHAGNEAHRAKIQSDTRIGWIDLRTGVVILSKPRAGGAYGVHLAAAPYNATISAEELLMLKAQIFATAHGHAGTNGIVYTDNSAALDVFQVQA